MDSPWTPVHWEVVMPPAPSSTTSHNQHALPELHSQSHDRLPPADKQNGLRKYTAKDWDIHRTEITRLYEKGTLGAVINIMREQHGLHATPKHSPKQYKDRIKKWGLDKNIKTNEMEAIIRKQQERTIERKSSAFRVRKRPVDQEKVNQYIAEHSLQPFEAIKDIGIEETLGPGATPEAISCYTPSDTGPLTPHAPSTPRASSNTCFDVDQRHVFYYQSPDSGSYQIGDSVPIPPWSFSPSEMTGGFQRQLSSISITASPIASSHTITVFSNDRITSQTLEPHSPTIDSRPLDCGVLQDSTKKSTCAEVDLPTERSRRNTFD